MSSRGDASRLALVTWLLWSGVEVLAGAQTECTPPDNETRVVPYEEMRADHVYESGTRVRLPNGRASFVVPDGWRVQWPDQSEGIIGFSESGVGFVMVFMMRQATEEDLVALLAMPQPITHDLVYEPTGVAERKGQHLTAFYRAGSLSGEAVAVMGPDQEAVVYFLGMSTAEPGQPAQSDILQAWVDSTIFHPMH